MLTELEAINIILGAIGESPVSTPDTQHPDVVSAKLQLKVARYELLAPGKWFNTERKVTLNPNVWNEVVLPQNCLSADPVNPGENFVKRGQKLYDATAHAYTFAAPVEADLVLDLPFTDLPFVAQNLVVYNAAHAMQANFVGDERKLQNLTARLSKAILEFNTAEINNGDYNIRQSAGVLKMLSGIRPGGK